MSLRIGLLGNSSLALPAVETLLQAGCLAGIGVPDIAHDANQRMQQLAQERSLSLAVVQAGSVDDDLCNWIAQGQLDAVFVVTFPYILPSCALAAPALGVFNFHASPLPRYRGPDPLFWQMRDGATESAVSAHRMSAGIDDGPIALAVPFPLTPDDTYGVANFRAGFAAGAAVGQLAALLEKDGKDLPLTDKDENLATRLARPQMDDLVIDWAAQSAEQVCALVRACNPTYGGTVSFFRGVPLRIYEAAPLPGQAGSEPGQILAIDPALVVACREGAVQLETLFTDDGVFSGPRFARLFGATPGESLRTQPGG